MSFERELSKKELVSLMKLYQSNITRKFFRKRAKSLSFFKEYMGMDYKGGHSHKFIQELISEGILVQSEDNNLLHPNFYVCKEKIKDVLEQEELLTTYEKIIKGELLIPI